MRKAAVVAAGVISVWFVPAGDLRGAAAEARVRREKLCPPFLVGGPPSSNPWCVPRIDAGRRRPVGADGAGPIADLPERSFERSILPGGNAGPADVLLGVTWADSALVSFDPARGEVLGRHTLLPPDWAFTGLAHDRSRHRLYALSQGSFVLTVIDTETLQTVDRVNLRVDPRFPGLTDTVALALDPGTGTLYTVVGRWTDYPAGPIWSQLAAIDTETGELAIVGRIDGPWIASLAFSETDRMLYGIGVYGAGPWDSPDPTHVMRIDPGTAEVETVFVTPYHTMLGFAVREPFTFFSWINWTSHFYGRTDLPEQTITPLGSADGVDVIYAMISRTFPLPPRAVPIPAQPVSFLMNGHVSDVWDPEGRLDGRVASGSRFAGQFSYDAAAPFKTPDPNSGPPYGISFAIEGLKYASSGLVASVVDDQYDWTAGSLTDSFQLTASAAPSARISWTLIDQTGEALQGAGKLPKSFDLPEWESNRFTVVGYDEQFERAVYAFSGSVDQSTRRDRRGIRPSSLPRPRIGR